MLTKQMIRGGAAGLVLIGAVAGSCVAATTPAAKPSLLYVVNSGPARVEIYPAGKANPAPIGTITAGIVSPSNLAIDADGTLYVQNGNNTITEYPRGATKPKTTLQASTPSGTGVFVAVGPDKTVYSTNRGEDDIYVYAGGGTVLTNVLGLPAPSKPASIAVSAKNDVYVAYANGNLPGNSGVYVFPAGQSLGHPLRISLTYPAGLALDASGNLLAGDAAAQTIGVYKPGAAKPLRTIKTAPCTPYQFNFDSTGKDLYVACGTPASVAIFDYATGSPAGTVSQGLSGFGFTLGVTLDPASK